MTDSVPFAQILLVLSLLAVAAVLSNRLTARLRIPTPALFLAAAAIAAAALPDLKAPPERTVERIVTVALVCILFNGGMHIGWRRFRQAAAPIVVVGVAGTFLTAAAAAAVAHFGFGFSWYIALLLGTVIAPTDPAVVFSILGQREIAGRSSTILEGESGANDPVGIALLVSLLAAGSLSGGAGLHVVGQFILQMGEGVAFGLLGGRALLWFMRRVWLPSEGLYPLRTLACALVLYGATAVAHGSGFLAVFVAGIVLGDERAPFKREIERFHSALASLGEIVAFVVLGLTVHLLDLTQPDVWVPGLVLGLSLALFIRPLLVGLCLIPAKLRATNRPSCSSPASRAPYPSCWEAFYWPRTSPARSGFTASSSSWWRSPSSSRALWCQPLSGRCTFRCGFCSPSPGRSGSAWLRSPWGCCV
jgi:cell volume regulation protein A